MIQRILDSVTEPIAASPSSLIVQQSSAVEDSRWKSAIPVAVLVASDTLAVVVALALVSFITRPFSPAALGQVPVDPLVWGAALPVILGALALSGVYSHPVSASLTGTFFRVAGVISFAGMAFSTVLLVASSATDDITSFIAVWMAALLLIPMGRIAAGPVLGLLHRHGIGKRPVIVIGTYPEVSAAARTVEAKGGPYQLAGVIELQTPDAGMGARTPGEHSRAATVSDDRGELHSLLAAGRGRSQFLIAAAASNLRDVETAVRPLLPDDAAVYLDLSVLLGGPETDGVGVIGNGMPAVRLKPRYDCWQYSFGKRAIDLVIASAALLVAAPLMLCIALAIKLDSPGPALFRQTRVGRYGRVFSMCKFRSMRTDAEAIQAELLAANEAKGPMFKIRNDPRMTRVGRVIRKLSLDELPQLFNVLSGSMSIVGPRPPLPQEVMQYEPWHLRRLELTPGITGLWQVSRNDTSSFDEMVQMDLDYSDRWCLALDVQILLRTVPAMVMARGAY